MPPRYHKCSACDTCKSCHICIEYEIRNNFFDSNKNVCFKNYGKSVNMNRVRRPIIDRNKTKKIIKQTYPKIVEVKPTNFVHPESDDVKDFMSATDSYFNDSEKICIDVSGKEIEYTIGDTIKISGCCAKIQGEEIKIINAGTLNFVELSQCTKFEGGSSNNVFTLPAGTWYIKSCPLLKKVCLTEFCVNINVDIEMFIYDYTNNILVNQLEYFKKENKYLLNKEINENEHVVIKIVNDNNDALLVTSMFYEYL